MLPRLRGSRGKSPPHSAASAGYRGSSGSLTPLSPPAQTSPSSGEAFFRRARAATEFVAPAPAGLGMVAGTGRRSSLKGGLLFGKRSSESKKAGDPVQMLSERIQTGIKSMLEFANMVKEHSSLRTKQCREEMNLLNKQLEVLNKEQAAAILSATTISSGQSSANTFTMSVVKVNLEQCEAEIQFSDSLSVVFIKPIFTFCEEASSKVSGLLEEYNKVSGNARSNVEKLFSELNECLKIFDSMKSIVAGKRLSSTRKKELLASFASKAHSLFESYENTRKEVNFLLKRANTDLIPRILAALSVLESERCMFFQQRLERYFDLTNEKFSSSQEGIKHLSSSRKKLKSDSPKEIESEYLSFLGSSENIESALPIDTSIFMEDSSLLYDKIQNINVGIIESSKTPDMEVEPSMTGSYGKSDSTSSDDTADDVIFVRAKVDITSSDSGALSCSKGRTIRITDAAHSEQWRGYVLGPVPGTEGFFSPENVEPFDFNETMELALVLELKLGRVLLQEFLVHEFNDENFDFLVAAFAFTRNSATLDKKQRMVEALRICEDFLLPDSRKMVNVNPKTRSEAVDRVMKASDVDDKVFNTVCQEVYKMVATDPYQRFKTSPFFKHLLTELKTKSKK